MDMNEEIMQAIAPKIYAYEFFYTNLFRSRLTVVADEYMDNPDEREATLNVIDTAKATITINGHKVTLSFSTGNDAWLEIIDEGLGPTFVNGKTKRMPDNSIEESNAIMAGGTYKDAVEPGSDVLEETQMMAEPLFKQDFEELMHDELVLEIIKGHLVEELQKAVRR